MVGGERRGSATRFGEFSGLTLIGSLPAAPALLSFFPVALGDTVLWSVVAAVGGVLLVVAARLVQYRRERTEVPA